MLSFIAYNSLQSTRNDETFLKLGVLEYKL